MVTAIGIMMLVAALISWLAARYLIWAMAPRGFWLRVAVAGGLPVTILILLLVAVGIWQAQDYKAAVASLARVPLRGWAMLFAMLVTGMGVSWLTAMRRKRRDRQQTDATLRVFQ
ncbi:hypothetical protein [Erythrobacter sp. CCH5-A1]|jgi:hypothetical protein|uniref:hypothetical protein n=1 Tax=Erythrobacter sp. CCH5-A1 TaxID=1768792 RepID=UPI00083433B7|nr:hypothetical protein [Erythrobacter sp. CCH5-A1]